jgi:predicted naringenin-chalcone synthase
MLETASISVPDSQDAIAWDVRDDGLHFSLTDKGVKSIPRITSALQGLIDGQGWINSELAPCAFHTGGNRIIDDVQKALGLTETQMGPTRECLRKGNTMSVAVLDALATIATDSEHRPEHGVPGVGAGYGPGFAAAAFSWRFHDVN